MKRLFVIAGLVTVVIGLCFLQRTFLNDCCQEMLQSLDRLEATCREGDFQATEQLAKEFEEAWVDYEKKLSYFIDNTDLAEVGEGLSGISNLATEQTKEELLSQIAVIRVGFVHIKSSNDITFESIF